jgi:PLP dependent protein
VKKFKNLSITENLYDLKNGLPEYVTLVAVSKTMPPSAIMEAYIAGHRIFGENKVQELASKYPLLPSDIEWHFIGHLQSNKVKQLIPIASLIQSADSERLVGLINDAGNSADYKVSILLQVKISGEDTKYGMTEEEARTVCQSYKDGKYGNIILRGLMGMASLTGDHRLIAKEFSFLGALFKDLKETVFKSDQLFTVLSMGMSDDYKTAIEAGSTMIRVGSLIFGLREKH